jgi:peptidoglycan/xylan/chitin deacetylase (PgdA/CDA1 family)
VTATVTISFDNLGEAADLGRGQWPEGEPVGRHHSVTRALPRVRALLDELDVRATFFVEGLNAELYPQTLTALAADGHEVAYHGWCHEPWAELDPGREHELLERGRQALAALGIELRGFRPPGGRLTAASPALLRELGFAHCSPAGTGTGVRGGVAVLPFRWELVDAFHVLPRFATVRAAQAPGLGAELAAALADGGHVGPVFHPFLLEDEARLSVLREFLLAARRAGAWCGPHRDVAVTGDDLRLDLTPT